MVWHELQHVLQMNNRNVLAHVQNDLGFHIITSEKTEGLSESLLKGEVKPPPEAPTVMANFPCLILMFV